MKKVLVIVGPTAVGKTSLSIKLAQKFNGEIISGDSIQIYKGLDIGSGKIKENEKEGIQHYCIDELEPNDNYSVADFQSLGRKYIEKITEENKLPMIVGGTGLYIKACLYDYVFNENEGFDEEEVKKYDEYSNEELYEQLKDVDMDSASLIHPNNRKRIIRALIIYSQNGISKSAIEKAQDHKMIYDALIVGCSMDRETLYERINQRVVTMVQEGLEEEVKALLNKGITFDDQSMQAIGYKEWKEYFEKKISIAEVVSLIQKNSRRFAKRQYTWFNRQTPITWIDMNNEKDLSALDTKIKEWLNEK